MNPLESHAEPQRGFEDPRKRQGELPIKITPDLPEYFIARKASREPRPARPGPERVTEEE